MNLIFLIFVINHDIKEIKIQFLTLLSLKDSFIFNHTSVSLCFTLLWGCVWYDDRGALQAQIWKTKCHTFQCSDCLQVCPAQKLFKLSNLAMLNKYLSWFCYCIACFMPLIFSKTHCSKLFICYLRAFVTRPPFFPVCNQTKQRFNLHVSLMAVTHYAAFLVQSSRLIALIGWSQHKCTHKNSGQFLLISHV